MKALVTGGSGFVGSALVDELRKNNHNVFCLVRREPKENEIQWDPSSGTLESSSLEGFDAIFHLAGESIASGRWTAAKKERIHQSRVQGTTLLSEKLAACTSKPSVLVSASAIGFYGDRGDEVVHEDSNPGEGFLVDVCRDWETSTAAAKNAGIRVVNGRIGVVLASHGGALSKMLLPFKLGMGGPVGNGKQWMSWISLEDLVRALIHVAENETYNGPTNLVASDPVTNKEFSKTLGRALTRPAFAPLPAFMAKLIMGEMAQDLLLASTRVEPRKLQGTFEYKHKILGDALDEILGRAC